MKNLLLLCGDDETAREKHAANLQSVLVVEIVETAETAKQGIIPVSTARDFCGLISCCIKYQM